MDAALRELYGEIDLATQRLLDDARILNETDLREASLLPGWTRAYVLAHLARGADVTRTLLAGLRSGAGAADGSLSEVAVATERSAAQPAAELATDLADSAMALRAAARQLTDDAWLTPVDVPGLAPFPAAEILPRRLAEVELHHCDLGTGYGPAQWSAVFTGLELAEPMRGQRQERLTRPVPARPTRPTRPVAPYQPGRPLPGSWIGRSPGRGLAAPGAGQRPPADHLGYPDGAVFFLGGRGKKIETRCW